MMGFFYYDSFSNLKR